MVKIQLFTVIIIEQGLLEWFKSLSLTKYVKIFAEKVSDFDHYHVNLCYFQGL